jgi:pyruvate/2-oxoacid:ferredoxin oxidoreductase beta subunit/Pyruvate/2-oxoacid:ferredoxin oxidoreductase gamma subunit
MSGAKYKTYINEEIGPLPFCPGCGHNTIAKVLDKALVKLQVDPRKTVLVTDIGCIGLTCRHFKTSAFHGLHGRSITYACGLKLARPDLNVIALKGDGACGIGGTHLLNVARRNIGITLIVANNLNYGMTGGQHSVTTPTDGITSTTPWGNVEGPMDLCGTAIAAGGSWVYRATMFDKHLEDRLVEAISQPGFAMVEIWELCTAYYMPRNELRKKELIDLLNHYGFRSGLLADNPRSEYSVKYREAYEKGKSVIKRRPPIAAGHSHSVNKQTGILVAGSAGQKIKSTATMYAEGAMFAGLNATQKDDYPITVQTGHSLAEIILSPDRIDYTGIEIPDYLLVISEDGLKKSRALIEQLPEATVVYADASLDLPDTKALVRRFKWIRSGGDIGKLSVATAALAAMLEDTGLYPVEAFADAIRRSQSPSIAATNLQAMEAGARLARDFS